MLRSHLLRRAHLAIVVAGAAASVATSKVESGDRAGDDCYYHCEDDPGPMCPAGETCSDATPDGLYFGGTPTGDVALFTGMWPKVIAVGGAQTIHVYRDPDGEVAFELPFEADVPAHLAQVGASNSSVTLRANEAGSGKLRIVEPGTELLYDRIDISAAVPADIAFVAAGDDVLFDWELFAQEKGVAALAGSGARVTAAAYTSGGARVVDEGMSFDAEAGIAADPEGFVDTIAITRAQPGWLTVDVHLGDTTLAATLRVVEGADDIVAIDDYHVLEGGERERCFRAENAGDAVLGADYSFSITGDATLRAFDDAAHCVTVLGTRAGTATLTVRAGGVRRAFEVEIVRPESAPARAAPPSPATAPERAARAVEGERGFLRALSAASSASPTGW